ncbi:MAG TPA: carboxymuconolactone decarboxylase family protein [Bryobacteraceae bacterium]|nr:carboxymuconolactone decarboxylase family protein [Bryobacteraceae bacterium]
MSTATVTATGISPVSKESAAPEVQPILDKLTQTFGKVPAFFGTMARVPEVLNTFMPFYAAVIDHGTVERHYKELAYLKASLTNGCEYCFRAHSSSGKKNGVTDDQIKALAFFHRSPLFDEKEKAVILYAERVTRGASAIRPGAIDELKKYFNDDQIVELTMATAVANLTNRFNDAMLNLPDIG